MPRPFTPIDCALTVLQVRGCDYIYVLGFRFKSGECLVRVSIDGKETLLSLIRDGKGRSRIDRWVDSRRPDGAVGEINLRDLKTMLLAREESSVILTVEGLELEVNIQSDITMGREGKSDVGSLRDAYTQMPEEKVKALAISQVRNASYGKGSADETRERVLLSMSFLEPSDLRKLGSQCGAALSALRDVDLVRALLGDCGVRAKKYSNHREFLPLSDQKFLDKIDLDSATDEEIRLLGDVFDEVTGSKNSERVPGHAIFRVLVSMYGDGTIDPLTCPGTRSALQALDLIERIREEDVFQDSDFTNMSDGVLKIVLSLDKKMWCAARHMTTEGVTAVLADGVNPNAVTGAWIEVERRGETDGLSHDDLIRSYRATRDMLSDPTSSRIHEELRKRELDMAKTRNGAFDVLRKTPSLESAKTILSKFEDEEIVELLGSKENRGTRVSDAAFGACVGELGDRKSTVIPEMLNSAIGNKDAVLGFALLKVAPTGELVRASTDPTPLIDFSSWCSEGLRELNSRLHRGDIGADFHRMFLTDMLESAMSKDVILAAAAVSGAYAYIYGDKRSTSDWAWSLISDRIASPEEALEVMKNHGKIGRSFTDGSPELARVIDRWGSEALAIPIRNLSLEAQRKENENQRFFDLTYSTEADGVRDVVRVMLSGGVDLDIPHSLIMSEDDQTVRFSYAARSSIAFAAAHRIAAVKSSTLGESIRGPVMEAFSVLIREAARTEDGCRNVETILSSLDGVAETGQIDGWLRSEAGDRDHLANELRRLKSTMESSGMFEKNGNSGSNVARHLNSLCQRLDSLAEPSSRDGEARTQPGTDKQNAMQPVTNVLSKIALGRRRKN